MVAGAVFSEDIPFCFGSKSTIRNCEINGRERAVSCIVACVYSPEFSNVI